MMRTLILLALASVPPAVVAVAHGDDSTSVASLTVMVPAETLRQRLLDVEHWPGMFSDVTSARVESVRGSLTQLEFASKLFRHKLGADLSSETPSSVILTVTRGPSAITIRQEWTLAPTIDGRGTAVTVRLLAKVDGWMGLVFPEVRLRGLRAEKLRTDLADLAREP
jgi:hypothetical protein